MVFQKIVPRLNNTLNSQFIMFFNLFGHLLTHEPTCRINSPYDYGNYPVHSNCTYRTHYGTIYSDSVDLLPAE
jgi:hypothetical protein